MKLRMSENSLFAILLRSPWWISFALAAGVAVLTILVLPERYAVPAAFGGTPFAIIGAIAAWRQLRAPSAARVASTLEVLAGMSWREFSTALEDALRRDGFEVTRIATPAADFEAVKAGRRSLVACKRWKAASTGVEPLRDLQRATEAREAQEGTYVLLGGLTDNAREFATRHRIRILQGAELAQMLRGVGRGAASPLQSGGR